MHLKLASIVRNDDHKENFADPVSGLTHLFATLAALVGLAILLIVARSDFWKRISLLIYGFSEVNPTCLRRVRLIICRRRGQGHPLAAQARSFSNLSADCRYLYTHLLDVLLAGIGAGEC